MASYEREWNWPSARFGGNGGLHLGLGLGLVPNLLDEEVSIVLHARRHQAVRESDD